MNTVTEIIDVPLRSLKTQTEDKTLLGDNIQTASMGQPTLLHIIRKACFISFAYYYSPNMCYKNTNRRKCNDFSRHKFFTCGICDLLKRNLTSSHVNFLRPLGNILREHIYPVIANITDICSWFSNTFKA